MTSPYGADVITLPLAWLTAVATSDARMAVFGLRTLYGVVRFLHLMTMAGLIGFSALLDLRGLGLFPPGALDAARPRLGLLLACCFWGAVATGLGLFLYNPLGIGLHTMFLPKLMLVAGGYALATARRRVGWLRAHARPAALVSLAVWVLVVGASTWNHVERPVDVGAALRAANVGKR